MWYDDYMATEVGVRELKSHLSEYLDNVERGEQVTVTRRGEPVAIIVPAKSETGLEKLVAEGVIAWGGRKPHLPKRIKLSPGPSASDYIIEERERLR